MNDNLDPHYSHNPARKVFNIDFDGTITVNNHNYTNPTPHVAVIDKIRSLYITGHIIIIWTARHWDNAHELVGFLTRFQVPYHGVMMAKGGADYYVDDKATTIETFLNMEIPK